MNESLDRILVTVERIAFTAIALYAAIFLITFGVSTDPSGYGRTLMGGLTVIFILAGVFLLVWVVATSINQAGNREKR